MHVRSAAQGGRVDRFEVGLAQDGRETGIVGYPGDEFFYGLLGNLPKHVP